MHALIDFILHSDTHLASMIHQYGAWTYAILALIIFCETGLVFLPILPGDSLLFAAGSLAAIGSLNAGYLVALLVAAAVVGDNVNYLAGRQVGPRAFSGQVRLLNPIYLDRTREFFARYGSKAIIMARFVPIVRTFTPFVAGVGEMWYPRFLGYDIAGGVLWVAACTLSGYFFGNIPLVRKNFTLVVVGIIIVSVLPMAVETWRHAVRRKTPPSPGTEIG